MNIISIEVRRGPGRGRGSGVRIAVLVKQVPRVEEMELVEGRLRREGIALEMNAYCRRAVSKGVELAAGGHCAVFTLGPPSAADVLREAVAWGADEGVLISDPAFIGSDTLATARALAAALQSWGPWDLILTGRNSIDADTGQVGPELAELLDLPFVAGVRQLDVDGWIATAESELDDGWRAVTVDLPAVLSVAERLTEPCKVGPEGRAVVDPSRLSTIRADELGPGPWGAAGSPTVVGDVRVMEVARRRLVLDGDPGSQVDRAVEFLESWGALTGLVHGAPPARLMPRQDLPGASGDRPRHPDVAVMPGRMPPQPGVVAVVVEPDRSRLAEELLGGARQLAAEIGAEVVVVGPDLGDRTRLAAGGAHRALSITHTEVEEDVADALAGWCRGEAPWAVLLPGTLWGREIGARLAAHMGYGLTGDAVSLSVEDGRLVAWKPALGGRLVAAVRSESPVQLVTVRPGVLHPSERGVRHQIPETELTGRARRRVRVIDSGRDDDVEALLSARAVVAVGTGVEPDAYPDLAPLLAALGAELAATRKVTDRRWLPRARQVGLTGHSVAPDVYVALALSGKFNHMVGTRGAGTVVAVNSDPAAAVFEWSDIGIVADWREVVPRLTGALARRREAATAL